MNKMIKRKQYSFYYSKRNRMILLSLLFVAFFFFLATGYSLLNTTFGINTELSIRPERDIRIATISNPTYANGAYETADVYYSHDFLGITGVLPKETSTIEYTLLITNSSSVDKTLDDITTSFSVEGISYELVGFVIGDEIAAGESVEVTVRFKRNATISNTTFRGELTFVFGNAYVDITPPVIVFNPVASDTWSTEDVNVNISASDDRSIISFKYCVTTDTECTPDTDADINGTDILLSEGKSIICTEAIDNAKNPNITNKCSNQYLIDKTAPTLTIDGCPTSGECTFETGRGLDFTLPSYTTSDNLGNVNVVTNGNVNTSIKDTYNVTYTATDEAGNSTNKVIKVIVREPNIGDAADQLLSNNTTYTYMGGTYLKGTISDNYVWYNGFIWRIMGKNADGSIRLITEEDVTSIAWGASDTAQDYGNSYIKDWVNNYFLSRLKDTSKIVSTSFCEDSTLVTSSSSRTTCSNPVLARAGILSLDEYNLAGGSSSYLKNGQDYWTLTPDSASSTWYVYYRGDTTFKGALGTSGVRVVISISSDTTITGGNGTLTANSDTEYVAGQTLDNVTGTLDSQTGSGEYVKFDGRLYRIVEHTDEGTKLILDGFYDVRTVYGEDFSTMNTLLTSSDFLNWLAPTRQADILNTTWYRGAYWTGGDYKTNLASTANPFTNKAGLIRVGEMLASQSLSLISSNYSKTNSYDNTKFYWTLTSKSASDAWSVEKKGYAGYDSVTYTNGVRPVIMVDSELEIESGNGVLSNPYELKFPIRIGEIAEQLLANNTTYTYMDGTYLSGAITNNYVWYNGFIWRIMGKNADGSVRLITEENVSDVPWGASKTAQDYSNSYIKDWVNNYFLPRLKDASKIVSTSFCEDSALVTDRSSARTTCSNSVPARSGILSYDEYNLAGGRSSYLVNGQYYWTLTPYSASSAWGVDDYADANGYSVTANALGVRAVISISSDTTITSGNGTLTANSDTEYVLGQTLDDVTGTLGSKAGSGEYVKFDGRLYRIVEHTNEGTKLILDGFYNTTTAYGTDFATMSTLLTSSDFLNWLAPTKQSDILNTTWYRGDYWGTSSTSYDYKTNLASTANPFTNKAGLIRVGEMLASQSLSLISSNYSTKNSDSNTKHYWPLTPYSASSAWDVGKSGFASYSSVASASGVRPVIMVDSELEIESGNGLLSNPYELKLPPQIGEIADQLLANNTTYTYMDGTYLSGAISNNYVWYNGFIWRIMGKNADGSIRLITEENVTAIPWGAKDTAQDYGNSYIKDWVNNYFLPRLKDTSKIVSTSFCEDSTAVTSSSARTTCSNPVLAQAGILSLDEYNLAGGSSSYLYTRQSYWTLTPYSVSNAWSVVDNGEANNSSVANARGVRAVISISADTTIISGNGTLTANSDTEYVAGQTLNNVTGTLGSKAGSGEYVKFDGRLYRIVEHTGEGTKLILDGFYDTATAYGSNFATMSTLLTSSDFLNWLAPTRQADIIDTTWYRGDYFTYGSDYKTNLASTAKPFTNKAGLIRVGEMLADQSLSLLTSNYSTTNSKSNTKNYWTLTPYSASGAWIAFDYGPAYTTSGTVALGVRPVIIISSSTNITSGNGTLSSPYEV